MKKAIRIIPILDIKNGLLIKGINFDKKVTLTSLPCQGQSRLITRSSAAFRSWRMHRMSANHPIKNVALLLHSHVEQRFMTQAREVCGMS